MGRPKREGVSRYKCGKIKHVEQIHPEVIAVRERQLDEDGIILEFRRYEGLREITLKTATDRLAGTSLGRLYLRWQQGERFEAINQKQYLAGEEWGGLVRRYSSMIWSQGVDVQSNSMEIGSAGQSCREPLEETILFIRGRFNDCKNVLKKVREDHGKRVSEVVFGICIQDWPLKYLYPDDFAKLRIGLNEVGRALDRHKR